MDRVQLIDEGAESEERRRRREAKKTMCDKDSRQRVLNSNSTSAIDALTEKIYKKFRTRLRVLLSNLAISSRKLE